MEIFYVVGIFTKVNGKLIFLFGKLVNIFCFFVLGMINSFLIFIPCLGTFFYSSLQFFPLRNLILDVSYFIGLVVIFKFQAGITIFVPIIHLTEILCNQVIFIKQIGKFASGFFFK